MKKLLIAVFALGGMVSPSMLASAQIINLNASGALSTGLNNYATTANDNGNPSEYNYSNSGYAYNSGGSPAAGGTTEYDGHASSPADALSMRFDSSYVELTGALLTAATTAAPVTQIQVNFKLDSSGAGGFFGDANYTDVLNATNVPFDGNYPGQQGPYHIQLPTSPLLEVQVTTDGTTWTTVGATSDYYSQLNGQDLGSNVVTPIVSKTVTFDLTNPSMAQGIEGIRLIGTHAGRGTGEGFIGINNFAVLSGSIPEPSTYAMISLGAAALFMAARFLSRARTS